MKVQKVLHENQNRNTDTIKVIQQLIIRKKNVSQAVKTIKTPSGMGLLFFIIIKQKAASNHLYQWWNFQGKNRWAGPSPPPTSHPSSYQKEDRSWELYSKPLFPFHYSAFSHLPFSTVYKTNCTKPHNQRSTHPLYFFLNFSFGLFANHPSKGERWKLALVADQAKALFFPLQRWVRKVKPVVLSFFPSRGKQMVLQNTTESTHFLISHCITICPFPNPAPPPIIPF